MSMHNAPICVKCELEMRPKKNGITVEEMAAAVGSYRLVMADLWACPQCSFEVVTGRAINPLAEHFEDRYRAELAMHEDLIRAWPNQHERERYESEHAGIPVLQPITRKTRQISCMNQHPEHPAYLCELPAGHDGNHTAADHDAAGARLVWQWVGFYTRVPSVPVSCLSRHPGYRILSCDRAHGHDGDHGCGYGGDAVTWEKTDA